MTSTLGGSYYAFYFIFEDSEAQLLSIITLLQALRQLLHHSKPQAPHGGNIRIYAKDYGE